MQAYALDMQNQAERTALKKDGGITMTRNQAKGNLISLGIEEPTDEQITAYLNSVNGESQKYKEKANQAEELQKQLDEINQQGMSEAEKAKADFEKAQETIASLQKQLNRSTAEGILKGAGLAEEDYKDFIDSMVFDDNEATKNFANQFVGIISKQKQAATDQAKKDLLDNTPTPGTHESEEKDTKSRAEKVAEQLASTANASAKASNDVMAQYLN